MFDPTNSDGQNSVNQREKGEKNKEKKKKKLPYLLSGVSPPLIIHFVFVFFLLFVWDPHITFYYIF